MPGLDRWVNSLGSNWCSLSRISSGWRSAPRSAFLAKRKDRDRGGSDFGGVEVLLDRHRRESHRTASRLLRSK
jgi:hypothetical protein